MKSSAAAMQTQVLSQTTRILCEQHMSHLRRLATLKGVWLEVLVYAGATIAAGAVVISGGTIVAAIVAATLAGGAGGIVGSVLAKWLGDHHATLSADANRSWRSPALGANQGRQG